MKKKLVSILSACIICATVFIACDSGGLNMRKLNRNMENVKGIMEMTMTIPGYGTTTEVMYQEIDGDKSYTYAIVAGEKDEEKYVAKEGSKYYEYTKGESGNWSKSETDDPNDNDLGDLTKDDLILSGDYYELSEDKCAQFAESILSSMPSQITGQSIEYIRFKIESNKVNEILMKMSLTMMSMNIAAEIKIMYSDYGNVSLTLPNVNG